MAKRCRTCRERVWRCELTETGLRDLVSGEPDCRFWSERETPLLVDALAEALSDVLTLSFAYSWKEAARYEQIMAQADAAWKRYQKEVGDA